MAGGLGTAASPFLIETVTDFLAITTDSTANKKHYKQTADLDFTGITTRSPAVTLYGSYDGGGYKIKNFNNTTSGNGFVFSYVDGGTVKNLEVDASCSWNGLFTLDRDYGIFGSAYANARFYNCINRANITVTASGSYGCVAGIAGVEVGNTVVISGCGNYGNITSPGTCAGIAVSEYIGNMPLNIESCFNVGNIRSTGKACGGIWATQNSGNPVIGTFSDCYNTGDIESTQAAAGGIATNSAFTVKNCINTGIISAYTFGAGICANTGTSGSASNLFALNTVIYRQPGSTSTAFNRVCSGTTLAPTNSYGLDTMEFRQL